MGLEVNLIKTLTKTVNECKTVARKGYRELFQLSKESPLRKRGFTEIEPLPGGNDWELRGKFSSILFSEVDNSATQTLHTGTRLNMSENGTTVTYGLGNNATSRSLLRGFTRTKDNITFHINGQREDITVPRTTSKSKIQEILFKLLGKRLPAQKWNVQEFDKRIAEDFSEEMIKPVHDYLEGNLKKEELVELIKKYKKNLFNPVIAQNNEMLETMNSTIPASFVSEEILDNLNIPTIMRKCPLYKIYSTNTTPSWRQKAQAILEEFLIAINLSPNKRTPIYRVVGKEEVDKILSGETVKARFQQGAFDVSTCRKITGDYRIKFNVEASEKTVDKTITPHYGLEELDYYYWKVPEYTIKDVRSVVDLRDKKIVYESDDEILSNFIDGYVSKLG